MAEGFEKISKKVVAVADNAKARAKELYDITKLKIELRKKEVELDEYLEKLGRAYFVQIKKGIDNSEKIEALVLQAENTSSEILDLKKSIADAQNKKICEHCTSIIDVDAPYCSNCGQKVVAEVKREDASSEE